MLQCVSAAACPTMDFGRRYSRVLRRIQPCMVRGSYADGASYPPEVAEGGVHGQACSLPHRNGGTARGHLYTSYKVANLPIEFSTSIPRIQLRPGYGDGFLGAPLQSVPPRERPSPRVQGGPRGTSRTHRQPNPGGAHHV